MQVFSSATPLCLVRTQRTCLYALATLLLHSWLTLSAIIWAFLTCQSFTYTRSLIGVSSWGSVWWVSLPGVSSWNLSPTQQSTPTECSSRSNKHSTGLQYKYKESCTIYLMLVFIKPLKLTIVTFSQLLPSSLSCD